MPPRFDGKTAAELATDAEDDVRGIAHLVEAYEEPLDPHSVYRALSGLTRLLEAVPEAATRLAAAMTRLHERGELIVSSGPFAGDPAAAIDAMTSGVDAMLTALGPAYAALYDAQAAVSGADVRDA